MSMLIRPIREAYLLASLSYRSAVTSGGILVLAQRHEARMAEMVVGRPLKELGLSDEERLDPSALRHLSSREPLPPAPSFGFWQVGERTGRRLELLESPKISRRERGVKPFRVRATYIRRSPS